MIDNRVIEFTELAKGTLPKSPSKATFHNKKLALRVIFEELHELAIALNMEIVFNDLCLNTQTATFKVDEKKDTTDVVEQADALGDIQFATQFAACILGHSKHMNRVFNDICESNNTKFCESLEDAKDTCDFHKETRSIDTQIERVRPGIYKVIDLHGKLMKNKYYKPVDLHYVKP